MIESHVHWYHVALFCVSSFCIGASLVMSWANRSLKRFVFYSKVQLREAMLSQMETDAFGIASMDPKMTPKQCADMLMQVRKQYMEESKNDLLKKAR